MFFTYIVYAYSSRSRRGFTARDVITPELLGTSAAARIVQMLPTRLERKLEAVSGSGGHSLLKAGVFLFGGAALLVVAANLTVSSLLGISDNENLAISAALAAMIVLSIGTAMPELFGSMSVVRDRKGELTLGNLFAATIANLLLVCGVASLFTPLVFGGIVLSVGLPFLALAAVLLTIAAITGRISSAQGMLFLLLYFLFFVKLLELF